MSSTILEKEKDRGLYDPRPVRTGPLTALIPLLHSANQGGETNSRHLNPRILSFGYMASGVYYYQLVAGEFRDIKKMILVK